MAALTGTILLTRSTLTEVSSDPAASLDHIVAGTAGSMGGGLGKSDQRTQAGSFRVYGNGNVRLILGAGQQRVQSLALRCITPSVLAQVEGLLGHTVLYRDTYGRRIFGAFLDMTAQALPFSGKFEDDTLLHDIGLTIQSITYDEAV